MTFDPIFHWSLIAIIGVALVAFSLWTYQPITRDRWLLIVLRTLAILLLVGVMLRPSLVYSQQQRLTSTLVFLVDRSRSMQLADETAGRTRWESVVMDLEAAAGPLAGLTNEVNTRWFEFGSALAETTREAIIDAKPVEDRTAIGESLDQIQRQMAGERIAGVVLLSDGTNTTGISPLNVARQFRSSKVPIDTFGYGQEVVSEQARDLVARGIRTNPTVFAKNRLPVTGEFDIAGFAGKPIMVKLLFNGVEQARGAFQSPEQAKRLLAELEAVPLVPGDLKVTLEATVEGDRQTSNNSVSTYVTVLAGGISVLEIEGKYRFWEPKYVRWGLDQSPDIELTQLFLLSEAGKKATLPDDVLQPGRFDVFILGDIAASQFSTDQLKSLAELIESRGMGLMMMGGYDSFGPGGWGTSPLANVLPVVMRPTDGQLEGQVQMVPTDAGLRHFIMRLAANAETNRQIWAALKPLDGASKWSSLKPSAQLLAETPDGTPLLAAETVGAGRSIAFAGDTTWRWRKDQKGIAYHARFWRQLILWLAKKEQAGSDTLKVALPTRRLAIGQNLPIVVQAISAEGAPLTDAVVQATVQTPDGRQVPVELFRQGDDYRGTFWESGSVGDFTLEVAGTSGTTDLGTTRVKFLVYAEDAEAQQPAADLSMLQAISSMTSGSFHRHLELAAFLKSLDKKDLNMEVSQPIVISLWDRWETLGAFVFLMMLEWIVRKRHGMV